jgi:hypothetical protein
VATVHTLEKGNLWFASKVDILSAVGNELHKTASHFCVLVIK